MAHSAGPLATSIRHLAREHGGCSVRQHQEAVCVGSPSKSDVSQHPFRLSLHTFWEYTALLRMAWERLGNAGKIAARSSLMPQLYYWFEAQYRPRPVTRWNRRKAANAAALPIQPSVRNGCQTGAHGGPSFVGSMWTLRVGTSDWETHMAVADNRLAMLALLDEIHGSPKSPEATRSRSKTAQCQHLWMFGATGCNRARDDFNVDSLRLRQRTGGNSEITGTSPHGLADRCLIRSWTRAPRPGTPGTRTTMAALRLKSCSPSFGSV